MKPIYLVSAWGNVNGKREFIALVLRAHANEADLGARLEFQERYGTHAEHVHLTLDCA